MKKWIFCLALMLALCSGVAKADALNNAMAAYSKGDYAQAIVFLRPIAEQGNARAQYHLGFMYSEGLGVSKDDREAAKWYRLAATQGDATSQCVLGLMYSAGRGVAQNHQEAVRWWQLAAAQGFESAQLNLAAGPKGDVYCVIGTVPVDALHVNAAQPQQTAPRRGSYLNEFVLGSVKGLLMAAVVGLIVVVAAFIRKIKAPARDATALTAAVGATAMQRLRQRMADYVGGTKECPFCKETVKARAVVCKHCHRDI